MTLTNNISSIGLDTKHLSEYTDRIKSSVENDPSLAIGETKSLIEATLKTILDGCSKEYDKKDDMQKLLKKVNEVLVLDPKDEAHNSKKGAESIKKVLSSINQIVIGIAELRNFYGSGHGRGKKLQGITSRHAKLVSSSGIALCTFLLETYENRESLNLEHLKSRSWQYLYTLSEPTKAVRCVDIHPSQPIIAGGGEDHMIRVWELKTGKLLHEYKRYFNEQESGDICSLTFSRDGKFIITTGYTRGHSSLQNIKERKIQFLDWNTGEVAEFLPNYARSDSNCSIALCPDQNQDIIAFDSSDKKINLYNIKLYDFRSKQYLKALNGHSSRVNTVTFMADGKILVSGDENGQLRIWDWQTGDSLKEIELSTKINAIKISPDNRFLAVGSSDSKIIVLNFTKKEIEKSLDGHSNSVCSLAFSPDGKFLASGSKDDTVKIWHIKTGTLLHSLESKSEWKGVWSLCFSQDSQILAAGLNGGGIKVWQLS